MDAFIFSQHLARVHLKPPFKYCAVHLECLLDKFLLDLFEIQQLFDLPKTHDLKCIWSLRWWGLFEPSTVFGFQLYLKLKVIFVCDSTLNSSILQTTTSNVRFSVLALGGSRAHPSIDMMTLVYSHMLTHWTRVEIVCDVVLVSWLCLVPPYAKCRVCEDMQVARCLCNFPPAPSEKTSSMLTTASQRACLWNHIRPGLNSRGSLRDPETLAALCGRGSGLPGWAGL